MNYWIFTPILVLAISLSLTALPFNNYKHFDCNTIREKALVKNVDFERYLGHWYELYHSNNFYFDHGCRCTTADYTLRNDTITVDNRCIRNGALVENVGRAKIIGNASLAVEFGIPIPAPYDIIYISEDYNFAGVLSCSNIPILGGLNLWILGRSPYGAFEVENVDDVFRRFREVGLDKYLNDLVQTNQTSCSEIEDYMSSLVENDYFFPSNMTNFDITKYMGTYNIIAEVPDFLENYFTKNCDCIQSIIHSNMSTVQICYQDNNRTQKITNLSGRIEPISTLLSQEGKFIQKEKFIMEHYQILDITDDYQHAVVVNELGMSYCVYFLSRTHSIPDDIFHRFIDRVEELDIYDTTKLRHLQTTCTF